MNEINQCFLSLESDQPLSILIFDEYWVKSVPLIPFMAGSLIGMSTEMKLRYAIAFRQFLKELEK